MQRSLRSRATRFLVSAAVAFGVSIFESVLAEAIAKDSKSCTQKSCKTATFVPHSKPNRETLLKRTSDGNGTIEIQCDYKTKLPAVAKVGFQEDDCERRIYLYNYDISLFEHRGIGNALALAGWTKMLGSAGTFVYPKKRIYYAIRYGAGCPAKKVVNGILNPDEMVTAVTELLSAKAVLHRHRRVIKLKNECYSNVIGNYDLDRYKSFQIILRSHEQPQEGWEGILSAFGAILIDDVTEPQTPTAFERCHSDFYGQASLDVKATAKTYKEEQTLIEKAIKDKCSGLNSDYKAVFIRPCEGQFFVSFDSDTTVVGKGGLYGVCQDLQDSFVTDVFVAFKVDSAGSKCGKDGELLYPSEKYPQNVSASFKGADPIRALIDTCYGNVRFHAWFPVFKDPKAIEYAKSKGVHGGQEAVGILPNLFGLYDVPLLSQVYANPAVGEVIKYELGLLDEIVHLYPDLEGMNLDYIRYADYDEFNNSYKGGLPLGYRVLVNSTDIANFVKKLREKYPTLILSADIAPTATKRSEVGQDRIFHYLDMALPMFYTGFNIDDSLVGDELKYLLSRYPSLTVLPILRGWACNEWCKFYENPQQFLSSLLLSINQVLTGGAPGYAVFTYESLIRDMGSDGLSDVLKW